ncbi:MAG: 4Fe-4S binding protein, partial [Cyanobacteria bacterium J06598_3]
FQGNAVSLGSNTVSRIGCFAIRWVIFLAWALLIVSLFYDPVSAILTHPDTGWSPLADPAIAKATDARNCIRAQGYCIPLESYAIGTRVFWGMVVPSAIFIVLVFGHEFWRRICPLYFFSQLPRALGMQPLSTIEQNQWLKKNHFYVQFTLFFLGITARILFVNSVRSLAALLFIFTLLAAASVVTVYGGRSWCHYVCPFGMVQTVFTGPRGLLDSQAHQAAPYSLTQSMCRTVDDQQQEQSACISCKSSCMDIDSEQSYWEQLYAPGRQLVQYGYLGLVIGYFCYYALYSGNFDYYFSGVWSHEPVTLRALLGDGFYVMKHGIAIPKLIAAPLTLAAFAAASCWLCTRLERYYRGYLKQHNAAATAEESLHKMFSLCTFIAFNIFFIYGGRPEINSWPVAAQFGFQALIGIVSSLWLTRTWGRTQSQYRQESLASKRRRQLKKLSVNLNDLLTTCGETRTIEQLTPAELNILAQTLPQLDSVPDTPTPPTIQDLPLPNTLMKRDLPKTAFPNRPEQEKRLPKMSLPKTQIRKR